MVKPVPEKAPSIKPLYADSDVGAKISTLVGDLRQLQASVSSSPMALLVEKLIAFLEIARLVKDDKIAASLSEDFQLVLMTLDNFFQGLQLPPTALAIDVLDGAGKLLVPHKDIEDLRSLSQKLRREVDTAKQELQDHLRLDHSELGRLGTMIGGVAANQRKALQAEEQLVGVLAELTISQARVRDLEISLNQERTQKAERNIASLEEQLARLDRTATRLVGLSQAEVSEVLPAASSNVSALSREIERRSEWLTRTAQMQAEAEDQREPLTACQAQLKEQLKFTPVGEARQSLEALLTRTDRQLADLDRYISDLVQLQDRVRRGGSYEVLEGYRRALSKVHDPKFEKDLDVAGAEVLPFVETLGQRDVSDLITNDDTDSDDESDDPVEGKRETLSQIAARVGLSPRNVLMITLFEILPRRKGVPPKRAESTIGTVASKLELLQGVGFRYRSFINFHTAETERVVFESYLAYSGKVNDVVIRRRTDRPLVWSVDDVITRNEKEVFLRTLAERDEAQLAKREQEKEGK